MTMTTAALDNGTDIFGADKVSGPPVLGTGEMCTMMYSVTPTKMSWDDSLEACHELGADLASIHSPDEEMAVWEMRNTVGGQMYIGHHEYDDENGERTWQWHDRSEMSYTNWHSGEPNNDAGQGRDCGTVGLWGDKTWNDVPCSHKTRAICHVKVCQIDLAPAGFIDPLNLEVVYQTGTAEHIVQVRNEKGNGSLGDNSLLYDHQCEEAIGHDGHYDELTGVWILDNDYDSEPEWRCLMRPFLRYGVEQVEEAELSIEAKTVVEEKKALIAVHERLVREAEEEHNEAKCLEEVEQAIARYEECELRVLRRYSKVAETYPTSWVDFLKEKRHCPNTFAEETAPCNPYFVW